MKNILRYILAITIVGFVTEGLQARQQWHDDGDDNPHISLFFKDGDKTVFGIYPGIVFHKKADGYTWSFIGDPDEKEYDIADIVLPIRPGQLVDPPELTTQVKIDSVLNVIQPTVNYSWIAELYSDNIIDNRVPHLPSPIWYKQQNHSFNQPCWSSYDDFLFRFEAAPQSRNEFYDSPADVWCDYYAAIAQANKVLQSVDYFETLAGNNVVGTLRAARAEALLQRAYLHFVLVNLFSQSYQTEEANMANTGIPYLTDVNEKVDKNVPAKSVAEVYACIRKDMEEGLSMIEFLADVKSKYRFTPAAAHAFAARFYLFTREWQKVIEHANAVLGTTEEELKPYMLNYANFHDLMWSHDYRDVWQNEDSPVNIMLNDTKSLLFRRQLGYRYACNGLPGRYTFMTYHAPLQGSYYVNPIGSVSGGEIWHTYDVNEYDDKDPFFYGMTSYEIDETFEYTDTVLNMGYPHVVMRRFTGQELLLARAEAYLMSGQNNMAKKDLKSWWNLQVGSFAAEDKSLYNIKYMSDADFDYFGSDTRFPFYSDWSFTRNISPDYIVPFDALPVMNCLHAFRRFETRQTGMRLFDLKRWGMEYEHVSYPDSTVIHLSSTDPRRAIQVPWNALYDNPDLLLETYTHTMEPGQQSNIGVLAGSGNYHFSNSNEDVVKMEWDSGMFINITALKKGTATITVTDTETGQTADLVVTVAYNDLKLSDNKTSFAQRQVIYLKSGNYDYSVETSDENIVTAYVDTIPGDSIYAMPREAWNDYHVVLLAHNDGQAVVTVKDNKSGQTAEIEVNIKQTETYTVGDTQFTMVNVDGTDEMIWTYDCNHDFAIGQTEVTQALWRAVMGENPANYTGDDRPVDNISWYDCQAFIEKLNELTGLSFRLPLREEWVYAASGGAITQQYSYSGSNSLDEVAWSGRNSGGESHDVATLKANELGIYDMAGNVWEWCQDGNEDDGVQKYYIMGGGYKIDPGNRYSRQCFTFNYNTTITPENEIGGLRLAR